MGDMLGNIVIKQDRRDWMRFIKRVSRKNRTKARPKWNSHIKCGPISNVVQIATVTL